MIFFYELFIQIFVLGMKIFSLFNAKAKKGIDGRKKSLDIIKKSFAKEEKVIWMHAASLGEYEQGLPVLESLKNKFPHYKILVTFFSPSGYENVIKKKNIVDAICYLPFDKKSTVREFVSYLNCDFFFTVKYDYWYLLLSELRKQNVKVFVISALFYEKQSFFKSYGNWFVTQLKKNVTWFFHQNEKSYVLAKNIGLLKSSVTGDTRFDRVKQIRNRDNHVDYIEDFVQEKLVLVFGSSWQAEEKIAEMIFNENLDIKIIVAPHDLGRVTHLQEIFPNAVLYSQLKNFNGNFNSNVLIINNIGLLSKLYSYADIAIVGGGFHTAGLHNILEAATFGVPVIFGNQYKKNPEADQLISVEGAQSFGDEKSTSQFVKNLIENEDLRKKMSKNAEEFIINQPNSTKLIVDKIVSL